MIWRLDKVISGGQTGADQGGLYAAELVGIPTGGTMPKGFRTAVGSNPVLAARFGLSEHTSPDYRWRTGINVRDADGTIRIATDFNSPGEILTLEYIKAYNRSHLKIDALHPPDPTEVVTWLASHQIHILNVAGNSEHNSLGIGEFTREYLLAVFEACGYERSKI